MSIKEATRQLNERNKSRIKEQPTENLWNAHHKAYSRYIVSPEGLIKESYLDIKNMIEEELKLRGELNNE